MIIKCYTVGDEIAKNDIYRLFKGAYDNTEVIIQEAIDYDKVMRNGYILNKLKNYSDEIEKHENGPFNYNFGFPNLIESINQNNNLYNIISFNGIRDISSVFPILRIWKNSLCVDLRTSAWMLGKLLKMVSFAHDNDIIINKINGNNILIYPGYDDNPNHYIIVFDWSECIIGATPLGIRNDIKLSAKLIAKAIGETNDVRPIEMPYVDIVKSLSDNGMSDAHKAYSMFYDVVDSIWEKELYQFTTTERLKNG